VPPVTGLPGERRIGEILVRRSDLITENKVTLVEGAVGERRNGKPRRTGGVTAVLMELLHEAARRQASDVHLVPGYAPAFRIHGKLETIGEEPLSGEQVEHMVHELVPERADAAPRAWGDSDSSVSIVHDGTPCRFRANVYVSQGNWCACLRHIPHEIPTFEWLGFPEGLAQKLTSLSNGLVILTGVTGSGKSASLAALINYLRKSGNHHVLTIEEPIEYIHPAGLGGIVTQREVGRDVESFADGLKYGLRQDPDVVLVGEIRDPDHHAHA
jgi:twitching motility protein PilT